MQKNVDLNSLKSDVDELIAVSADLDNLKSDVDRLNVNIAFCLISVGPQINPAF